MNISKLVFSTGLATLVPLALSAATLTTSATSGISWRECQDYLLCPAQSYTQAQSGAGHVSARASNNLGFGYAEANASDVSGTTLNAYGSGTGYSGGQFISAGGSASATMHDVIFAQPGAVYLQVSILTGGTSWDGGPSWATWNIGNIANGKGATIGGWDYRGILIVPIDTTIAITGQVFAAAGVSGFPGGTVYSDYSTAMLQFSYIYLDGGFQPIATAVVHNPEPGTMILIGAGVIFMLISRRRK